MYFVMFIASRIAIEEEIKETEINKIKLFWLRFSIILDMATTAPFLALSIAYNVNMLKIMLDVFIPLAKTRNKLPLIFLNIDVPIEDASAELKPGRTVVKKLEMKIEEKTVIFSLFVIFGYEIIWFGIFVLLFKLVNNVLIPNKPESIGKRTSLMPRENETIPSIPELKNSRKARNLDFFSLIIKITLADIKI